MQAIKLEISVQESLVIGTIIAFHKRCGCAPAISRLANNPLIRCVVGGDAELDRIIRGFRDKGIVVIDRSHSALSDAPFDSCDRILLPLTMHSTRKAASVLFEQLSQDVDRASEERRQASSKVITQAMTKTLQDLFR